jgi:hypothetical protein
MACHIAANNLGYCFLQWTPTYYNEVLKVSNVAAVRTALHCTALHCTALHCTALDCTALDWRQTDSNTSVCSCLVLCAALNRSPVIIVRCAVMQCRCAVCISGFFSFWLVVLVLVLGVGAGCSDLVPWHHRHLAPLHHRLHREPLAQWWHCPPNHTETLLNARLNHTGGKCGALCPGAYAVAGMRCELLSVYRNVISWIRILGKLPRGRRKGTLC